ncbi:hypothetical protein CPSG_05124 [Coccidioides posadasii str. Silveira]|uniref:Uncharacterized protein n=1 Tax=Coccidioides posadasii (strain RMSCC 757 / Silveira) TaxID=443226 RepID=E9D4K6_COCPS|nr:hypothetical protein CPSG_05124 [Coccidioides posadasii str. Silveira]
MLRWKFHWKFSLSLSLFLSLCASASPAPPLPLLCSGSVGSRLSGRTGAAEPGSKHHQSH